MQQLKLRDSGGVEAAVALVGDRAVVLEGGDLKLPENEVRVGDEDKGEFSAWDAERAVLEY